MVQGESLKDKYFGGIRENWRNAVIFLVPFIIFFLFQSCIQFPPSGIKAGNAVYTVVMLEVLSLSLGLIFGNLKLTLVLLSLIFMILGMAENYVFRFRGSFLNPSDFLSALTAFNVVSNYDFTPPLSLIVIILSFILLIVLTLLFCPAFPNWPLLKKTGSRIAAGAALLLIFTGMVQFVRVYPAGEEKGILEISDNAFHSDRNNRKEGAVIRLLYDSGSMLVKKPSGYSKAAAEEELKGFDGREGAAPSKEELPDIIVIMNESFSDPKVDGPLETDKDYMPFVHSLQEGQENTVTGCLNVSVQGGNTPNTEFEFLTGNTLAFLPKGSIPFQQFITGDIEAMPRYLRDLGYDTIAMHPYYSNGWNRTKAYPALGFSDMKFLEYFEEKGPEYVRKYVSDKSFFKAIEEEVEKRNDDGPVFSFNVTMQNHGSYEKEYDNYKKEIHIIAEEGTPHVEKLTTYLDLVKLSDEAFEELVEYYKGIDRKTLILFFGDHQPATVNLEPVFHNMGTDRRNLDEETEWNIYRVPFVIWANYDIEEEKDIETSANYLGNLLLKKAGIPLYPYRVFTDGFSQKVPVISAVRTVDAAGESRNLGEPEPDLSQYERLQYYELFDRKIK